jgi:hypothetical protein
VASRHGILSSKGGAWTQDWGLRAGLVGVAVAVRSLFVSQYRLRAYEAGANIWDYLGIGVSLSAIGMRLCLSTNILVKVDFYFFY